MAPWACPSALGQGAKAPEERSRPSRPHEHGLRRSRGPLRHGRALVHGKRPLNVARDPGAPRSTIKEIVNKTGYDTKDLRKFFERGARAHGVRGLRVGVVPSPNRSRGCATVGGKDVVMSLAPPSKFSAPKLARLYEHELLHVQGKEHEDMADRDLWSKGKAPKWALGLKLTYKRRGESILP